MLDPDAAGHGMPPSTSNLVTLPAGAIEGVNDFGRRGYAGRCPRPTSFLLALS